MQKSLIALVFIWAIAAASATAAPVFTLSNIPVGWDGQLEIKLQNSEDFGAGISFGSQNYGVLKVTSMVDPSSGNTLWTDGQGGAEITGVFNATTVSSITPSGGQFVVDSTGGILNLFINPTGSLTSAGGFQQGTGGYGNAGCGIATLCYHGITDVGTGGSFLNANWVPGVSPSDPTATVSGTFNTLTFPVTGTAQGYLSVTGGPYAGQFDTDGFPVGGGFADLFAQNDFCTPGQTGCIDLSAAGGAPPGGWQLRSNDPMRAMLASIPEPEVLSLLGLAVAMAAAVRRR